MVVALVDCKGRNSGDTSGSTGCSCSTCGFSCNIGVSSLMYLK